MFACLYVPDFAVQAALLLEPPNARATIRQSPLVILDGPAKLLKVVALNDPARAIELELGMTKLQVETCGGVQIRKRSAEHEDAAQTLLTECANAFSPSVESTCPGTVILDLAGTEKLFGTLESTTEKIRLSASSYGFELHVGIAANADTAFYAAQGFSGITIIPAGQESARLAHLPVSLLPLTDEMLDTLTVWGIRNFASFAALPEISLTERLGQAGLHLQRLARGCIERTLVPIEPESEFREQYEFDDPVETLESLSFALNRLLQQVCDRLRAQALATNELRLILDLAIAQRREDNETEQYRHEWKLPVPTQDGRMLFILARLDLSRQTFSAPIKRVTIEAVPITPRTAQGNLFAPPAPETENLEITLARIRGVVGSFDADGRSCVGSPELLDTHKPHTFCVRSFSSETGLKTSPVAISPYVVLRIFRPPLEATVKLSGETPHVVNLQRKGNLVLASSGPWCSSGEWWNGSRWSREEWDIALETNEGVGLYRLYRDMNEQRWFVEGIFD